MNQSRLWKVTKWSVPLVLTISLIACGSEEVATPAPQQQPEPAKVTEPITPEKPAEVVYTAPLTGLPVDQPSISRPIAVMINNAPAARPQSGLAQADMVYEVLAEGGITRLIAVYQSYHGDVTIGPVRSIRPYLIGIGESMNALLVHAGGSPEAYSILQQGNKEHLDEITNASVPFWRDSSRKAPHNLYTNEEKLRKGALQKKYKQEVTMPTYPFLPSTASSNVSNATTDSLNTDASSVAKDSDSLHTNKVSADNSSGITNTTETQHSTDSTDEMSSTGIISSVPTATKATSIELQFLLESYKVGYDYNAKSGVYTRSMNHEPHIDLNSGKPLTASNIIVLGGDYKVLDDIGRLSLNLDAGGEAILFQQGQQIKGQWSKKSGDVIRFMSNGQEVPLVPGVTYYNIVPNSPSFENHLTIDGKKLSENG
ncbi:DUF3048 domain-containing protein [Paenibacillus nicotianae]|uniref:DUF3048 domain-containing protein n=1 Tax=Paenibacillus nicotianae TaxID=1526551 RepID=A0ABW4UWE9_9BACL